MPQFKCGTKEKDVNKLRRFKAEFINRPASELREWEESVTESRRKKNNAQSTAEPVEESKWNCQGKMYGCGDEPCSCLNRPHSRGGIVENPRNGKGVESEGQEDGGKGWRGWWKRNLNFSKIWENPSKEITEQQMNAIIEKVMAKFSFTLVKH